MKNAIILVFIFIFAAAAFAQSGDAAADLKAALAAETNAERVALLEAFLTNYPASELLPEAKGSLTVARAAFADEKLRTGDQTGAVELFNKAIDDAPQPIPDKLFSEVVARFPANLFWNGSRKAAFEIARRIEEKAAGNSAQLVRLGSFYLSIEDGANAKRTAETAIAADPNSAPAYQMLGLASRMNFDLNAAVEAYAKALEIAPESITARKSLAEMKRATGKPDEAAALYGEVLAADPADSSARTGYALSLFDAGKRTEAEAETAKLLETNPNNLLLLSGAAYWYAANGEGVKAEEFARKAIAAEPRYIWSHIALGRALIAQNDPIGAERALVAARQHANFPTLEYEIAAARLHAGFYREAAEELSKSFSVENGRIHTRLGRRIDRDAESFAELVGVERRASMFESNSAAKPAEAELMKSLLVLNKNVRSGAADEVVAASVAAFTAGDDNMRFHRTLYTANLLLESNTALPVVKELTSAALGKADDALNVAAPAAAVMASELYESRTIAFARGEMIIVPDVPRPTLSAILRGRVEELAGRTFYLQENYPEAIVRLRRAISVLPEKSSWWRSSLWRLGLAFEADGQDAEAMKAYVQSYVSAEPDITKYVVVERMFKKIYGGTEGLEKLIGPNPLTALVGEPESETPSESSGSSTEKTAETAASTASAQTSTESLLAGSEPVSQVTIPTQNAPRVVPIDRKVPLAVPAATLSEPSGVTASAERSADKVIVAEKPENPAGDETGNDSAATETETGTETGTDVISTNIPTVDLSGEAKNETPASNPQNVKPLFDPIVIEVPSSIDPKPDKTLAEDLSAKPTEPDANENANAAGDELNTAEPEIPLNDAAVEISIAAAKTDAAEKTEPISLDPSAATKTNTDGPPSENAADAEPELIEAAKNNALPRISNDGTTRERIVPGVEIREEKTAQCSITASQDSVSILNDGGSLGILIGVEGGSVETLTAESNSPNDVEVVGEPPIGNVANRRFYIIRSISTRPGMYEVKFKTDCGERIFPVRVR